MNFKEFSYCFINLFILAATLLNNVEACEKSFFVIWTIFIIKNKNTYFNKYILGSKLMTTIGKASYSIYLWHMGIITLITFDTPFVALGAAVLGLVMYPLEARIRKATHRFIIPGIGIFGVTLLASCIAIQL